MASLGVFYRGSGARFRLPGVLCSIVVLTAGLRAEPYRARVEADWKKQDACRMALVLEPGVVRIPGEELVWPGIAQEASLRVALAPPPVVDGRLEEASWKGATVVPPAAPEMPRLLLTHDGAHIFVGASFPSRLEEGLLGPRTALDASGAVDGIRNGRYGFHTGHEPNPWWQVDLGSEVRISRVVVYNRLDYAPGLHNADSLLVLVSGNGRKWSVVHDNEGRHFGGVGQGKPLEISPGVRARFLRLQIPSATPIFFHLDEVEVYAAEEPEKNIALGRPALQSSLSPWSRGGASGAALVAFGSAGRVAELLSKAPRSRQDGSTSVELALPLADFPGGFPTEITPPGGRPLRLRAGAPWRLLREDDAALGFGRNRLELTLLSDGALDPPVEVSVESVVFTRQRPERDTLGRKSLRAAGGFTIDAVVEHEGPAALIVTAHQGAVEIRESRTFFVEPVAETLERAETLLQTFGLADPPGMQSLRERAASLAARERTRGSDPEARSVLCLEARWLARRIAFSNPGLEADSLVCVKRFTQETYPDVCLNHMPWVSRPGGDICVLSGLGPDREPEVRELIGGALGPGHVHGMDLFWDASRVVFGYARARREEPPDGWLDRRTSYRLRRTEEPTHIYEVGIDGTGLRQLTSGEWSDLDPTYLPDGGVAFASERCGYSLQCNELDKDETSCNLYAMGPDGEGIRRLSVTKDGDYLPHTLADGSIGYTRWEYQERGWAHIQSIWTVRPDGTGADAIFKQHFNDPWALEDTRSIPGSAKLAAIATGHHTLAAGPLVIIDPRGGFNTPDGIRIVTPGILPPEGGMSGRCVPEGGVPGRGGFFRTPWPLSESTFLVSRNYGPQTEPAGYAIYLVDVHGTMELIYRDPEISCFLPIPLAPRTRPPVLADSRPAHLREPLLPSRQPSPTQPSPTRQPSPTQGHPTGPEIPTQGNFPGLEIPTQGSPGASTQGRDSAPPLPADGVLLALQVPRAEQVAATGVVPPARTQGSSAGTEGSSGATQGPSGASGAATQGWVGTRGELPGRQAACVVSNVGRGVEGVDPEAIRYLRIAQRMAWPYTNEDGGERYEPDVKAVMVNWTPVRVLGTVPVEDDGSAYFLVPDDTPVYFQLLDGDFMELRRMRSFVSFQPGEVRGCVGCHETRPEAPAPSAFPRALAKPPRVPEPPPWGGDRALSFLKDVQPVFDRHCISCHGGLDPAGKLDLTGGLTARHNRAYDSIQEYGLVSRSHVGDDARITQPLEFGSHKSRLLEVLRSRKHSQEMTLGREEWLRLVTWIDGNAPYHDGFINKRSEPRPYDLPADRELAAAIRSVHERRCNSCHDSSSDDGHTAAAVTRLDWIDLYHPEHSRFLRAPLSRNAGGEGTCTSPAYSSRDDPDYQRLLKAVRSAVRQAWARPRRDLRALVDKADKEVGNKPTWAEKRTGQAPECEEQ